MNILQRIKNLWNWSSITPPENEIKKQQLFSSFFEKASFIEPISDKERWDNAETVDDLIIN